MAALMTAAVQGGPTLASLTKDEKLLIAAIQARDEQAAVRLFTRLLYGK